MLPCQRLPAPCPPVRRMCTVAAAGKGGGKGGGGKSGKPRGAAGPKKQQAATGFGPPIKRTGNSSQQQVSFLSSPISVELQDELTKTEFAETPRWDTFCNHLSGEWVGQYGAYTPWEAKSEPVWQDDKKRYLDWVYSRCIEYPGQLDDGQEDDDDMSSSSEEVGSAEPGGRGGGVWEGQAEASASGKSQREIALTGGVDQVLIRRLTRAVTVEQLSDLRLEPLEGAALSAQQEGGPAASSSSGGVDESVDVEALSNNTNGVVFFNGGSYSAGPDFIGPPNYKILQDMGPSTGAEDEGADAGELQGGSSGSRVGEAEASGRSAGQTRAALEEEESGGEGALTPAPGSISIMESCLVDWASKSRVRLKVTVRTTHDPGNGEVEMEVLRVLLFREFWVGQVGCSAADVQAAVQESHMSELPCTELPRASRNSLHGSWAVFTTSALAIEDSNPFTGEPMVSWVYMTNEDRQLWSVPRGPPSEEDDSGAALWLPGGVVFSLRMVDLASQAEGGSDANGDEEGSSAFAAASAYEGDPQEAAASSSRSSEENISSSSRRPARGLSFGFSWCLPSGSGAGASLQVCSVERDYDGAGVLRGVRSSTAVKGGWSGGKM
mmetsp:Transcript_1784/g.4515  ORF Transcript_1784/g.4515 Transcript_1784/m.4515 type:complete len:608 (+) Transcript_1784:845-2668(+)